MFSHIAMFLKSNSIKSLSTLKILLLVTWIYLLLVCVQCVVWPQKRLFMIILHFWWKVKKARFSQNILKKNLSLDLREGWAQSPGMHRQNSSCSSLQLVTDSLSSQQPNHQSRPLLFFVNKIFIKWERALHGSFPYYLCDLSVQNVWGCQQIKSNQKLFSLNVYSALSKNNLLQQSKYSKYSQK